MAKVWVPPYIKADGTRVKGFYRNVKTSKSPTEIDLQENIKLARKAMKGSKSGYATIWQQSGGSYGFNFDKKPKGYSMSDGGITRTVVKVLRANKAK